MPLSSGTIQVLKNALQKEAPKHANAHSKINWDVRRIVSP
jgi:hypothetical protein